MKYIWSLQLALSILVCCAAHGIDNAAPDVAEFNFRNSSQSTLPSWLLRFDQREGKFVENPGAWVVGKDSPPGTGMLWLELDRSNLSEDLAMGLVYDNDPEANLIVQLFDDQNHPVALDLFSNVVGRARSAKTDTFIIPLKRHPSATKVVLRRLSGPVSVYGFVLWPVISATEVTRKESPAATTLAPVMAPNVAVQAVQQIARRAEQTKGSDSKTNSAAGSQPQLLGIIESPANNSRVPRVTKISGHLPAHNAQDHLWLFVQVGRFLWPKGEVNIHGKSWDANLQEDGNPPDGRFFVSLYSLNPEGHQRAESYVERGKRTSSYPALIQVVGGSRLDRISLQLEPD